MDKNDRNAIFWLALTDITRNLLSNMLLRLHIYLIF